PAVRRARDLFVGAVFMLLMVLVYGGAELQAWGDASGPKELAHSVDYYRVIFSIWATIVLVAPALWFNIFSFRTGANTYWRAFWTFAYLAFLVHVYWAIWGTCGGDLHVVFNAKVAPPAHPECLVEHPGPDLFLVAWWGLDVILAWLITDNIKWLRVERGAVH